MSADSAQGDDRAIVREATEELLRLAKEARAAIRESDSRRIVGVQQRIRERVDGARGIVRALYEVAEAFTRTLSFGGFDPDVLAVLEFLERHKLDGARLLEQVARSGALSQAELSRESDGVGRDIESLARRGVFRVDGERLVLRSGLRAIVRDICEPPIFRMWRHVETERRRLALAALTERDRADALATSLGVSAAQAQLHLTAYPLPSAQGRTAVLFRREGRLKTRPDAAESATESGTARVDPGIALGDDANVNEIAPTNGHQAISRVGASANVASA